MTEKLDEVVLSKIASKIANNSASYHGDVRSSKKVSVPIYSCTSPKNHSMKQETIPTEVYHEENASTAKDTISNNFVID